MIFGRSHRAWLDRAGTWHRIFAWDYHELEDGRFVWLEFCMRKWEKSDPIRGLPGYWIYRTIPNEQRQATR